MVRHLKTLAPGWVPTDQLEMLVRLELGVAFETAAERKRWYDNSFRKQLKVLVEEGEAERLQDPADMSSEVGAWRWMQAKELTLAELRQSR